jgi:kindlin 2
MMNSDGLLVDGSWLLNIRVTDLIDGQDREKSLRVKGDLHVGGLMLRLVEMLCKYIYKIYFISA